ncbi:hypothetical protein [Rubritalea tangerina]|uniref:hypothetical protein n=1 Tax=Rubritalea tangerina TaxID=430798 RepID=UPI003620CE09
MINPLSNIIFDSIQEGRDISPTKSLTTSHQLSDQPNRIQSQHNTSKPRALNRSMGGVHFSSI